MIRRALLILALAASPVAAQSDYEHHIGRIGDVVFMNRHPNCNPFTKAFDPVWFNNVGWSMPRVGWMAMDAVLNLGITYTLKKFLPKKLAVNAGPQPLMWGPHIGQAIRDIRANGEYVMNAPDWLFDPWNRSLPMWLFADTNHITRHFLTWAAGDAALYCFARP